MAQFISKKFKSGFLRFIESLTGNESLLIKSDDAAEPYYITVSDLLAGRVTTQQLSDEVTARNAAITQAISDLKAGAPLAYDTLMEIASKLQADDSALANLFGILGGKADITDLNKKVDKIALASVTTAPGGPVDLEYYFDSTTKKIYQSRPYQGRYIFGYIGGVAPIPINPTTGILYTCNGSNYVWKQTDLIEIGTGGTSGGSFPSVTANLLTDFNDLLNAGTFSILGNFPGMYIGTFSNPSLKQMVIWNNKIYSRSVNVSTTPVIFPDFTDGGEAPDLSNLQEKLDGLFTIEYFQTDEPHSQQSGDSWFNPTSKIMNVWVTSGTPFWLSINISGNFVYKFNRNFYIWTGTDMLCISDVSAFVTREEFLANIAGLNSSISGVANGIQTSLENVVNIDSAPTSYLIGQTIGAGKIGYILQPSDPEYDSSVQKGIVVETVWNTDSKNWTDAIEMQTSELRLPTLPELLQIWLSKDVLGYTAETFWTSDETDDTHAASVAMGSGIPGEDLKTSMNKVRRVWSFENHISVPISEELVVFQGNTGKQVKGSGITLSYIFSKIAELWTKKANQSTNKAVSGASYSGYEDADVDVSVFSGKAYCDDFGQVIRNTYANINDGLSVNQKKILNTIPLVCSDEITDITVSTTIRKNRYVFQITQSFTSIVAELIVAAVGGNFSIDIKKNGTSVFSTPLTFNSGSNTTRTASTPYVLIANPVSFVIGDYVEVFVTGIGSITAGQGLTVYLM